MLELRPVPIDHPDAARLVAEVQQVYVERYGDVDLTSIAPVEFTAPRGHFVVGYVDGDAVASGGWRARDPGCDPALLAGDAEIKRMYVVPGHRGRGLARAVLAELERTARAAGLRRAVLETGTRQPEAIALYVSAGYEPIPGFGVYRCVSDSRCFAKVLAVGGAPAGSARERRTRLAGRGPLRPR